MRVLVEHVHDGTVGRFQSMTAGDLDQLSRLRHAVDICSLIERQAHGVYCDTQPIRVASLIAPLLSQCSRQDGPARDPARGSHG
jgi:hypothetical protein